MGTSSAALGQHWDLDPAVVFLNHGSFGASPREVLAHQARLRRRLEAEPVRFLVRELPGLRDAARGELAGFLSVDPADLVFVQNATTGINAALTSFPLAADDRILITDHGYNACGNAVREVAARRGAHVDVARLPFPLTSADQVVAAVSAALRPRTRLAVIDHVTSPTGLVLPVERLVAELAIQGVEVVVDGAHAPGMLPLALGELGAAYYAGNAHKWICAPKGAGFLHVRRGLHGVTRPPVISHGANAPLDGRSRLHLEFDWTGTADPTPYLCIPTALTTVGGLIPGGWPAVRERNRALALAGRHLLARILGVEAPCPDEMIGSLAAVPLPDGAHTELEPPLYHDPLQEALWERHRIEVPIIPWPRAPGRLVRISAQLYNDLDQVERLATALLDCLGRER